MKSLHCIYNKNQFDDQYTHELDGFMSPHEFKATMNTFNTAALHYPPPVHQNTFSGRGSYLTIASITMIMTFVIFLIHETHQIGFILSLPFSFLFLSMMLIYCKRRQRTKFENALLHLCSCMNATENVRGINFRLTYLTPEQQQAHPISATSTHSNIATYAITIDFDDRYNLLHHFNNNSSTAPLPPPHLPSYYSSLSISPPHYSPDTVSEATREKDDTITKPLITYHPTNSSMNNSEKMV